MRTGRHGHADFQIPVDERVVAVGGSLDGELSDRRPVEQHLDLMGLRVLQPVDIPGITTREVDLDVMLAVLRERVRNEHPAARADGESRYMPLLRDIGRDANDVALKRGLRAPDCQRADFLRSRNVSVQKSRGQVADRHVVEAVTAFIGGQERCGVDVDGQEISDGVLILGSIETPQRFRAAWIRLRWRRLCRATFPTTTAAPGDLPSRAAACWEAASCPCEVLHDLLPDLSAFAWVGDIGFVQLQSRGRESLVVAGDAVAIERRDGSTR